MLFFKRLKVSPDIEEIEEARLRIKGRFLAEAPPTNVESLWGLLDSEELSRSTIEAVPNEPVSKPVGNREPDRVWPDQIPSRNYIRNGESHRPPPTIKRFLVGWLIAYLFLMFFLPGYGLMLLVALPVGAGVASMLPWGRD